MKPDNKNIKTHIQLPDVLVMGPKTTSLILSVTLKMYQGLINLQSVLTGLGSIQIIICATSHGSKYATD